MCFARVEYNLRRYRRFTQVDNSDDLFKVRCWAAHVIITELLHLFVYFNYYNIIFGWRDLYLSRISYFGAVAVFPKPFRPHGPPAPRERVTTDLRVLGLHVIYFLIFPNVILALRFFSLPTLKTYIIL